MDKLYNDVAQPWLLPKDEKWMDYLDILSAIRLEIRDINKFQRFDAYIVSKLKKYQVFGINQESFEFSGLMEEFKDCGLPVNCFIPHILKPNHLLLDIPNNIENLKGVTDEGAPVILSESQKKVLKKAITLLRKDESNNVELKKALISEMDKYTHIKMAKEWWNRLPVYFSITCVGEALANAYVQYKNPVVPNLY